MHAIQKVAHQGHWIIPWAQRHPPQVGKVLPKQSSSFAREKSQPPQNAQGENWKACTRSLMATYSGLDHSSVMVCPLTLPTTYRFERRFRSFK
jgi:hypothetical protein